MSFILPVTCKHCYREAWRETKVNSARGEFHPGWSFMCNIPTKVIQQTFLPLSFYLKKPTTTTASTKKGKKSDLYINPFVPNAPLLHPLKTSENRKVFWCFQGVEKGCIGNEWIERFLMISNNYLLTHLLINELTHTLVQVRCS